MSPPDLVTEAAGTCRTPEWSESRNNPPTVLVSAGILCIYGHMKVGCRPEDGDGGARQSGVSIDQDIGLLWTPGPSGSGNA